MSLLAASVSDQLSPSDDSALAAALLLASHAERPANPHPTEPVRIQVFMPSEGISDVEEDGTLLPLRRSGYVVRVFRGADKIDATETLALSSLLAPESDITIVFGGFSWERIIQMESPSLFRNVIVSTGNPSIAFHDLWKSHPAIVIFRQDPNWRLVPLAARTLLHFGVTHPTADFAYHSSPLGIILNFEAFRRQE